MIDCIWKAAGQIGNEIWIVPWDSICHFIDSKCMSALRVTDGVCILQRCVSVANISGN
jgi:hypothetical protein